MKITIDTDVLQREHIPIGDFLVLLIGYYGADYMESHARLSERGLVQQDIFKKSSIILSDNTRNLVARILTESDCKVTGSSIDSTALAKQLQQLYPSEVKAGTTYEWQGKTEEIAQKLMTVVAKCDFSFTEEEAIAATRE